MRRALLSLSLPVLWVGLNLSCVVGLVKEANLKYSVGYLVHDQNRNHD